MGSKQIDYSYYTREGNAHKSKKQCTRDKDEGNFRICPTNWNGRILPEPIPCNNKNSSMPPPPPPARNPLNGIANNDLNKNFGLPPGVPFLNSNDRSRDHRGFPSPHPRFTFRDDFHRRNLDGIPNHSPHPRFTFRDDLHHRNMDGIPMSSQQKECSSVSFSSSTSLSRDSCGRQQRTSNIMATSAISVRDTNHGHLRRYQRNIPSRDIQEAIKYGRRTADPNNRNCFIYEYNGKKHVIDDVTGELITSMVLCVDLPKKKISKTARERHDQAKIEIKENLSLWKSHTILVVDKSGSMRNSDVSGSRTRLGAVWLSIAQDFVERRIKAEGAGNMDVISIILMGKTPEVLIDRYPTDDVLYNEIVDHFEDSKLNPWPTRRRKRKKGRRRIIPNGHGCYAPALEKAGDMLVENDNGSCALMLLVLSDGRPSDFYLNKISRDQSKEELSKQTGEMASKYGRRFTFSTIGIGSMREFATLKAMAHSATDFGSDGRFQLPSMTCASIGAAFSSVATSLTTTQTELTDHVGGKQRKVRHCTRERRSQLPILTEVVNNEEFDIYMDDNVEHYEYQPNEPSAKSFKKGDLQHKEARGVAIKKTVFGEGSERLAHQFFEVAADGKTVVGESLVAKESRFIEEEESNRRELSQSTEAKWKERDNFIKRFCKTHHVARKAAKEFNSKLDNILKLDPDTCRVSFLDCSLYYLTDEEKGEYAVLVEKHLQGKFQKWNNNNGWHNVKRKRKSELDMVKEEGEMDGEDGTIECPIDLDKEYLFVTKDEIAQAFSHFSYIYSGKKMLICDLQGVHDATNNMMRFTDPVIHYHDARNEKKKGLYGRTDMGQKGISNFFKTHECNSLCSLVTKGFITPSTSKRS